MRRIPRNRLPVDWPRLETLVRCVLGLAILFLSLGQPPAVRAQAGDALFFPAVSPTSTIYITNSGSAAATDLTVTTSLGGSPVNPGPLNRGATVSLPGSSLGSAVSDFAL
ncbi:MAG TPA: hypothetical protein VF813_07115, partial [Anaerolineaceae bacterium]